MDVTPSTDGTFEKTVNTTVNVSTDNYSGYTLMIASADSTSLINANDDKIESISNVVSESNFSSSNTYNNQ